MLVNVVGHTLAAVEAALTQISLYSNVVVGIPALADKSLADGSFEGAGEGVAKT